MILSGEQEIRVLIVEDEPLVAEMAWGVLEELAYEVVGIAIDGEQALEMIQTLAPDVVLMDLGLPDMDGFEVTRLIQARFPTPVVMLTAYNSPALMERAREVGAGAYLVKPGSLASMEWAITIALARFEDMKELRRLQDMLQVEVKKRQQMEYELQMYRLVSELFLDYAYAFRVEANGNLVPEWHAASILPQPAGANADDVYGYGIWENMIYPDDLPTAFAHAQILFSGRPHMSELRVIDPNGDVHWVRGYDLPVWDDQEERVIRIYGATQDITRRKQVGLLNSEVARD
ncbi:MAG: response regulator [Anaerolineae bacterium]|nr:response regulator [Anaerolineae bacterium]